MIKKKKDESKLIKPVSKIKMLNKKSKKKSLI